MCHDGVMRTAMDYADGHILEGHPTLAFGISSFSRSAFDAASRLSLEDDPTTLAVEREGEQWLAAPRLNTVVHFSEVVCEWGRGERVFANLQRHHASRLQDLLFEWLGQVPVLDANEAIARGIGIKGLGVSFASKHLRMLQPDRFAVLDEVLEQGLGFAGNPAGYQFFLKTLEEFKQREHLGGMSFASIEAAVFQLVRQGVRASSPLSSASLC